MYCDASKNPLAEKSKMWFDNTLFSNNFSQC